MPVLPKFTLPLLGVLALSGASAAFAQNPEIFSRAPYLQFATRDSIRVVWRTRTPVLPVVKWGVDPAKPDGELRHPDILVRRTKEDGAQCAESQLLHSAPEGTYQFEATITGLQPDTRYHYAIYDGDTRLTPDDGTYTFTTLPVPGAERPYSFWVVGDSGTGTASQKAVYDAFLKWRQEKQKNIDFYVHVGDMAYNRGTDSEFQYGFFRAYEPLLRNTVCWPSMGNHEGATSNGPRAVGPYYDAYVVPTRGEAGGLPSGTEAYYSWDYGRTHFICLNSHDLPRQSEAPMAQWLKADLEKTKADWIIAYWHHPPYTKGSHDSDKERDLREIREHILPIIESGGVDLVLTGHSHIYERSMLIDGAYDTPTVAENKVLDDGDGNPQGDGAYRKPEGTPPNRGTVQIVAGHGGQVLSRKESPSPVMKRTIVEWGSVIVEVNGNTLTATMLNADGQERDTFQIVKSPSAPAARRIANPAPPLPPEGPEKLRKYEPAAVAR